MREVDRLYSILTRDFGLIRASATGVRKEESKLRGVLEPVTLAEVSLVRGKEFWRITSAQTIKKVAVTPEIARPLSLLEKLVQGEVAHPELFDVVEQHLEGGEIALVAQILLHLGYLKPEDINLPEKELIGAINKGFQASHLI